MAEGIIDRVIITGGSSEYSKFANPYCYFDAIVVSDQQFNKTTCNWQNVGSTDIENKYFTKSGGTYTAKASFWAITCVSDGTTSTVVAKNYTAGDVIITQTWGLRVIVICKSTLIHSALADGKNANSAQHSWKEWTQATNTITSGSQNVDIHDVMAAMSKSEISVNVATQMIGKVINAYDRITQISI